jgi:hypothetical protein
MEVPAKQERQGLSAETCKAKEPVRGFNTAKGAAGELAAPFKHRLVSLFQPL